MSTIRRHAPLAVLILAAAFALTGCAAAATSSGGPPPPSTGAGSPSAAAPSASALAAAPSATASAAPCTSHACIVQELDQSLVGGIDQADAVATKVHCYESTVKDQGNGTWTASCMVTYSDGSTADGTGTVDTSQDKVTFEPN